MTGYSYWTFSDERHALSHFIVEHEVGYGHGVVTLCGADLFVEPPRGGAWSSDSPLPTCPACVSARSALPSSTSVVHANPALAAEQETVVDGQRGRNSGMAADKHDDGSAVRAKGMQGHFRIVIEVEDDRHLRRLWSAIDWEDELFNGNISVHVQEVEYVHDGELRWTVIPRAVNGEAR